MGIVVVLQSDYLENYSTQHSYAILSKFGSSQGALDLPYLIYASRTLAGSPTAVTPAGMGLTTTAPAPIGDAPRRKQENRPGADPSIGTNGNGIEVLQVGSLDIAVGGPAILALAAGDHDTGCFGSFSDIDTGQDGIRPDVDPGAHLGLSMRNERSELNAGAHMGRRQA